MRKTVICTYAVLFALVLSTQLYAQTRSIYLNQKTGKPIRHELNLMAGGLFSNPSIFGSYYNQFRPGFGVNLGHSWHRDLLSFGVELSFSQTGLVRQPVDNIQYNPLNQEYTVFPRKHTYEIRFINRLYLLSFRKLDLNFLLALGYSHQITTEAKYSYYLIGSSETFYSISRIRGGGVNLGYGLELTIPINPKFQCNVFFRQQYLFMKEHYTKTVNNLNEKEVTVYNLNNQILVGVGVNYILNSSAH